MFLQECSVLLCSRILWTSSEAVCGYSFVTEKRYAEVRVEVEVPSGKTLPKTNLERQPKTKTSDAMSSREATKSAILGTCTQTLGSTVLWTRSEAVHGCSFVMEKCYTEVRVAMQSGKNYQKQIWKDSQK